MKAGKIWGQTELIHANGVLEFHRIEFKKNVACSKHKHKYKWNGFYVGALAGANAGQITQCYADVDISAFNCVGGLVGYNANTIINCYSRGVVRRNGSSTIGNVHGYGYESVGGLVGLHGNLAGGRGQRRLGEDSGRGSNDIPPILKNTYSGVMVSGSPLPIGGLVGNGSSGDIVQSYYLEQNETTNELGQKLTSYQMKDQVNFVGWDFVEEDDNGTDDIWWIDDGNDYPRLWWELE